MLFWMVGWQMMSGGLGWVGTNGLVALLGLSLRGDAVGGAGRSSEGGGVGGGEVVCMPESRVTNGPMK